MGTRILISCGEASADLYAGELLRALRTVEPELECFGLGGEKLNEAGGELLAKLEDVSVIGLVEVVEKLPGLRRTMRKLVSEAGKRRPDAAVLIDFSGFNLRLARKLKTLDIPIVYYVSPQVWAWRRRRVRTIRETVTRMLVILPFEKAFYRAHGVPVSFVGHPLVDLAVTREGREAFCRRHGLEPARPLVALLPGSRTGELSLHLPILVKAVQHMRARLPEIQFVVLKAHSVNRGLIENGLGPEARRIPIAEGATYDGLTHATAAIVASGTATVDAALCETPMVVVYRVGKLSYALGKPFVRVPYYAMVNLVAEKKIVPELIQSDMTPERVADEALVLVGDQGVADKMRQELRAVKAKLGPGGASGRAAEAVLSVAGSKTPGGRVDVLEQTAT